MTSHHTATLGQIGRALRREAWLVVSIALAVLLATSVGTLLYPIAFRSQTRLYLGDVRRPQPDAPKGTPWRETMDEVTSEMEVLRSESLIERAVLRSGLNARLAPAATTPDDELSFYRWLVGGEDAALIDAPRSYVRVSDAVLDGSAGSARLFDLQLWADGRVALSPRAEPPASPLASQIDAAQPSPTVQAKLGERIELAGLSMTLSPGPKEVPAAGLRLSLRVEPHRAVARQAARRLLVFAPKGGQRDGPISIVTLQFLDRSPTLAAELLSALLDEYLELRGGWRTAENRALEGLLGEQASTASQALVRDEQRLAEHRKEHSDLENLSPAVLTERMRKLADRREQTRLERRSLELYLGQLRGGNAGSEAPLAGETRDAVIQRLSHELVRAQLDLQALAARYKDGTAELQGGRAKVAALTRSLRRYVEQRFSDVGSRLSALDAELEQLRQRAGRVPEAMAASGLLGRDAKVREEVLVERLRGEQEAAMRVAGSVSKVRLLDAPLVAQKPHTPRLSRALSSVFLGLLLGVAWVMVRAIRERAFRDEQEVRAHAAGLPVAAVLSRPCCEDLTLEHAGASSGAPAPRGALARRVPPLSRTQDEMRAVYASLLSAGAGSKVVAWTAAQAGTEVRRCALAFAASLAADGRRVLVIDADFRRAAEPRTNVPHGPGLLDACQMHTAETPMLTLQDVCHPLGSFDYVGVGRSSRPARLDAGALDNLLREARLRYEFVVCDAGAGPAHVSRDMILVRSDVTFSVVRVRQSERRATALHLSRLSASPVSAAIVIEPARASRSG